MYSIITALNKIKPNNEEKVWLGKNSWIKIEKSTTVLNYSYMEYSSVKTDMFIIRNTVIGT